MDYAELCCRSYYSFLHGASSPEALVGNAAQLGLKSLALTDTDGLYGVVPFVQAAKACELRPIIGSVVTLADGDRVVLLCQNLHGYHNLSRLITRGRMRSEKGTSAVLMEDFAELNKGLICLAGVKGGTLARLVVEKRYPSAESLVRRYRACFGARNLYIALTDHLERADRERCRKLAQLADAFGLRCVATNAVHYARADDGKLHDVLRCIQRRAVLDEGLLPENHHRFLKSSTEMTALFAEFPQAVWQTLEVAERCCVEIDFSEYRFPDFPCPDGQSADAFLAQRCEDGLSKRYQPVTREVRRRLDEELSLIQRLGLSGYFLVVWDIVQFALSRGIPTQGRGSAANSLVSYLLGITPVDPIRYDLFFGRFLNDERRTTPDIDLDFASARGPNASDREDVIRYVYQKYGKEYAALTCTFITFRGRSAVREVGLAFGYPLELLDTLSRLVEGGSTESAFAKIGEVGRWREYVADPMWAHFLAMADAIRGIPRHLSLHPGGMVITSFPIAELVPIEPARKENVTVCQWDKDMVEDGGLIKVDLLGLGMLSVTREALHWASEIAGRTIRPDEIPPDDPEVYAMMGEGDTVGVFQVESRVQIQTLPKTQPRNLLELAIQVAIIRPGPIQGGMVKPYIARRRGEAPVTYPHPRLEAILKDTLGVVLFQEQVLQVVVEIAGYTPGQAEELRRTLGKTRSKQKLNALREEFICAATGNGVSQAEAERIYACIEGFASYGFCKSHALAFAHLAYVSAWLKRYYPAAFFCGLLNSQPMGFYGENTLVQEAGRRGLSFLPVDINRSGSRCSVEKSGNGLCIRLGLLQVRGVSVERAAMIEEARKDGMFVSLEDFARRTRLDAKPMEHLILAGGLDSLGLPRRGLLWQLWLFDLWRDKYTDNLIDPDLLPPPLPPQSLWERLQTEYGALGFSAGLHPLGLVREQLTGQKLKSIAALHAMPSGAYVRVAAVLICMQRPPTAKGVAFLLMEDETGLVNVTVKPQVYEQHRLLLKLEPMLRVEGTLQKQGKVLNVVAKRFARLGVT